jgi:KaiC/GvpD/RAD55 family RecA-like ATPase
VRADGGYVVAPSSIHPETGKAYAWLCTGTGKPSELIPEAFRQMVVEREEFTQSGSSVVTVDNDIYDTLAGVPAGGRNHAAAKITGWFLKVTKGDENAAWTMLSAWNGRNDPPLPEHELARTFESILRAYRNTHDEQEVTHEAQSVVLLTGSAWADAVRDVPPRHGIPAPSLPALDQVGGVVAGDLILLAGRPGMGKSTGAWGTVVDVALEAGAPTVVFSTEMTAADVARWIASKMHRVPVASLTTEEWNAALGLIAKSPVTICDQGAMTVEAIVKIVEGLPDTRYVVIDHMQRIRSARRSDSRNQELEYIASTLKSLAKDRKLTVLGLSQMNRTGDINERPRLGMLRDSGGLEQEADAVIFLWSPAEDSTANPLEVEFYLAKNRHGALDAVRCWFHKHLKYFETQDATKHLGTLRSQASHKEKLNSMLAALDF